MSLYIYILRITALSELQIIRKPVTRGYVACHFIQAKCTWRIATILYIASVRAIGQQERLVPLAMCARHRETHLLIVSTHRF